MTEGYPEERAPSVGELEKIVYGPSAPTTGEQLATEFSIQEFDSALREFNAAMDRGDLRVIEECEQRLSDILEVSPSLREKFHSED